MIEENEAEVYKKELTSDFNEAKFQIYRLHILWLTCNTISNAGELTKWKWKLDTIWRELSPDATQKDRDKEEKDKTLAVRIRGDKKIKTFKIKEFIEDLKEEIEERI